MIHQPHVCHRKYYFSPQIIHTQKKSRISLRIYSSQGGTDRSQNMGQTGIGARIWSPNLVFLFLRRGAKHVLRSEQLFNSEKQSFDGTQPRRNRRKKWRCFIAPDRADSFEVHSKRLFFWVRIPFLASQTDQVPLQKNHLSFKNQSF